MVVIRELESYGVRNTAKLINVFMLFSHLAMGLGTFGDQAVVSQRKYWLFNPPARRGHGI